ncbi:uncharacterized protein LOC105201400 [Solenopsis invicta]|uniref:uncharacterized protein LOC105201400 n=1 Tax=Solenopsis invicta TaxID=13686 RepID=UPI000595BE30|nr:uncharacterized protein LOC105201400 [Solenopsis invicta]XP_039311222.1 uncharacterized protein LOC105201400 [Solenopsis invicta]
MKYLHVGIVLFIYNYMIRGQDLIFPAVEETFHVSGGNSTIITERVPVSIPDRCPQNMLLYPGSGSKDSWVCDCKPRYLYFPLNNSCYEAYRQGPCLSRHYVVLVKDEAVPRCMKNPCFEDGVVPYNGTCYPLKTIGGPCSSKEMLTVNEITFQLECMSVALRDNISSFVTVPTVLKRMPLRGSRRSLLAIVLNV